MKVPVIILLLLIQESVWSKKSMKLTKAAKKIKLAKKNKKSKLAKGEKKVKKTQKPSAAPNGEEFSSSSMGFIRNRMFYTGFDQPIRASLPIFSNASLNFYSDCDDLKLALTNAASIMANQIILDNSKIDPVIFESGSGATKLETAPSTQFTTSTNSEDSFSTNNQEDDVEEADIVKSTNKHVFAAYGDQLVVWDVLTGKKLSVTVMPQTDYYAPLENPIIVSEDAPDVKGKDSKKTLYDAGRNKIVSWYERRVQISGLLLDALRLTVIATDYQAFYRPYFYNKDTSDRPLFNSYAKTKIYIYDVSTIPIDGGELSLVVSHDFDGSYQSARAVQNTLHVITTTNIDTYTFLFQPLARYNYETSLNSTEYIEIATKNAIDTLIPSFVDKFIEALSTVESRCEDVMTLSTFQTTADGSASAVPYINVFMEAVTNIITVDMQQSPLKDKSDAAVSMAYSMIYSFVPNSWGTTVYASSEILVLGTTGYEYISEEWEQTTNLLVFKLSNDAAKVKGLGVASVPGYLLNSYAIDVWDGHLRVATTRTTKWGCRETKLSEADGYFCEWVMLSDSDNMVIILALPQKSGDVMEQTGILNHLGEVGETIYAIRFMDDKAYMTTFRQTDPLYALDLSDHYHPKEMGYLKIQGFSNYLHPYNDDGSILITVGQDVDGNGTIAGLQITLINVTDLSSPSLLQSYVVEDDNDIYSSSDAAYDAKAFRFLPNSKKLILPVVMWNYATWNNFDGFHIFDVSLDDGITLSFKVNHALEGDDQMCWYSAYLPARSFVHNGVVTTIKGHNVVASNLDAAKELWRLNLDANNTKCSVGGYWVY